MSRPKRPAKKVLTIDGARFATLDEFYDEVERGLGITGWGRNLDAFNDILRGGFGTPEGGFVLRWIDSARSAKLLPGKFDRLVEIIRVHCAGGREAEDGVELELR